MPTRLTFALLLAALTTTLCRADTLFTLAASYANGDTTAGTLDLDTATGLILGGTATVFTSSGDFISNVTITPGPPAMGIQRGRGSYDALLVYLGPSAPFANIALQLDLPTTTLGGYAGGMFVSSPLFSNLVMPGVYPSPLVSGSLTPGTSSTATPEPSTLVLLGTGLSGLVALLRRPRSTASRSIAAPGTHS